VLRLFTDGCTDNDTDNRFFSFLCEPLASRNHALIVPCADYLIALLCSIGLGQLQSGMTMSGFGQLGQQSTGSLGSSLSLGNSGLPINSPSQSVYHTNYGLNSISKLPRALARSTGIYYSKYPMKT